MTKRWAFLAVVALVCFAVSPARALDPDELMPGKIGIIKPNKLAKFVAKPVVPLVFDLPDGSPVTFGATLQFFDTVFSSPLNDNTYTAAPGGQWKALGNPPGIKGYKYKGAGTLSDPCKVILIKEKVVKGVCKGPAVTFDVPFAGNLGIILSAGNTPKRYCAVFGGTPKGDPNVLLKRKGAPAPGSCPVPPAAPTGTPTNTPTNTFTITPTATATPTHTNSPTATNTVPPTDTPTVTPTVPPATATPTRTPTNTATNTRTPTLTPTPSPTNTLPPCPLTSGIYTNTQTSGGMLTVDGITPFPFPTGGTIIQHVSAASQPTCVHTTVVPDPGGFTAPIFCIPSLNFSVQVTQDGCGVGRIDSNGGSDFTITEIGDTSSPTVCGLPASNCLPPPGDSNVQVNLTVGDSVADVCGSGTANAAVVVPVHTITWSHVPLINCNLSGPDTTGPGGMGDTTVVEFDQNLDFTTDTTSADWSDLDPDGCCLSGNGPASAQACAFGGGGGGPIGSMGTCINLAGVNVAGADVTTVAAGTIGSNGAPLYDLTFSTSLPNAVTGPSGAASATCASPPIVNFAGLAMRCIP